MSIFDTGSDMTECQRAVCKHRQKMPRTVLVEACDRFAFSSGLCSASGISTIYVFPPYACLSLLYLACSMLTFEASTVCGLLPSAIVTQAVTCLNASVPYASCSKIHTGKRHVYSAG